MLLPKARWTIHFLTLRFIAFFKVWRRWPRCHLPDQWSFVCDSVVQSCGRKPGQNHFFDQYRWRQHEKSSFPVSVHVPDRLGTLRGHPLPSQDSCPQRNRRVRHRSEGEFLGEEFFEVDWRCAVSWLKECFRSLLFFILLLYFCCYFIFSFYHHFIFISFIISSCSSFSIIYFRLTIINEIKTKNIAVFSRSKMVTVFLINCNSLLRLGQGEVASDEQHERSGQSRIPQVGRRWREEHHSHPGRFAFL